MKTKFNLLITSIILLVSIAIPTKLKAEKNTHDAPRSITTAAQEEILESRLTEINAMDKSNLSRLQKKKDLIYCLTFFQDILILKRIFISLVSPVMPI